MPINSTPSEALAAGWRAADWMWEQQQERAAVLANKKIAAATALWTDCLQQAQTHFSGDDPRLAASYFNVFVATSTQDDILLATARQIWALSPAWVDCMRLEQRARSSLHHFRLEEKNRRAYETTARRCWHEYAAEARLMVNQPKTEIADMAIAANYLVRWNKEKPQSFSDARKLLAACLLMINNRSQN